jgi:hypothetical protein
MARLLRLSLAALLVAAPALFSFAPRAAHAFCIGCDDTHVHEYVNEITGHYLLLPEFDPEVAIVEGGGACIGKPVLRVYRAGDHRYTADTALRDVADHFLARVAFNNETYLDARLGATVVGLSAQVWYVE